MSAAEKTDPAAAASALPGWSVANEREAIRKIFKFRDFNAAFGWMCRVAMFAEAADHHPEWSNVYNTVDVTLTTHDAGGVTAKDIAMAWFMDNAALAH